jgi:light-regulated signal transduction histidine kinase (bacteriophytochrome)
MNRDLQDFAFVASHDLQEPLRTIQTYCTRIEAVHGETLCLEVRESLRRVVKNASRMRDLIDGMYLYHRATQKSLVVEEIDLKTLIEEVLVEFQEDILESEGIVELEPLPAISAEPPQMRRLFQSLIANSLKYRRREAPPIIRICGETEGDSCRISVSDNGIGFDEKHLNRIFRPFQRLHGRDEYEGAGMGLTICRKVVENHHGAITATSTPGEGTTFRITLPIRQTTA